MAFKLFQILVISTLLSCAGKYNKGITNKKDFKPNNPPSVRIRGEYEKEAKKASRGRKSLKGKEGKDLEKAQAKLKHKKLKKDKRYLKRRRRKLKKSK